MGQGWVNREVSGFSDKNQQVRPGALHDAPKIGVLNEGTWKEEA